MKLEYERRVLASTFSVVSIEYGRDSQSSSTQSFLTSWGGELYYTTDIYHMYWSADTSRTGRLTKKNINLAKKPGGQLARNRVCFLRCEEAERDVRKRQGLGIE